MICSNCKASVDRRDGFCRRCGSPLPAIESAFADAESAYAELRRGFESGSLSAQAFEARAKEIVVDHQGEFWMLGVESGGWYIHRDGAWHGAEPPRRQASPAAPRSPAGGAAGGVSSAVRQSPRPSPMSLVALAGFILASASTVVPWYTASVPGYSETELVWELFESHGAWVLGFGVTGAVIALVHAATKGRGRLGFLRFALPILGLLLAAVGLDSYDQIAPGTIETTSGPYTRIIGAGPVFLMAGGAIAAIAGLVGMFRKG